MMIRAFACGVLLWLALLTAAIYGPLAIRVLRYWLADASVRQAVVPTVEESDDFAAYIEWLAQAGVPIREACTAMDMWLLMHAVSGVK